VATVTGPTPPGTAKSIRNNRRFRERIINTLILMPIEEKRKGRINSIATDISRICDDPEGEF
jgi:hypothetical protein